MEETELELRKDMALCPTEGTAFELIPEDKLRNDLITIRKWQNTVKELLVPKLDYGLIPGCGDKPSLFKPGAEKLAKLHQLADTYELVKEIEDWDKPMFYYYYRCTLTHMPTQTVVSQGIGSCNSKESKYGARWVGEKELPEGSKKEDFKQKWRRGKFGSYPVYMVINDDIFSQVNTLQKMAKKRAFLDATLSACRLSAIFTQDIEDLPQTTQDVVEVEPSEAQTPSSPTVESVAKKEEPTAKPVAEPKVAKDPLEPASEKQVKYISSCLAKKKITDEEFKAHILATLGVDSRLMIPKKKVDGVLEWIANYKKEA